MLASLVATIGLLAAACVQPAPAAGHPPFSFRATDVTAESQTEFVWGVNTHDEPYLVNIWFRVTIGKANSASAGVVSSRGASPEPSVCETGHQGGFGYCDSGDESYNFVNTAQTAQVTFGNVPRFDVTDLLNVNNKLQVMGVWTWAMEEDWIGNPIPGLLVDTLVSVLNQTLAAAAVPNDPNFLAQIIVDNLGDAIAMGGSSLLNLLSGFLFGIGDDLLSSRIYTYVGAGGSLAGLINAASVNLAGFNADLASAGIPSVDGITVRAASPSTLNNQTFVGSGADHRYTIVTS
jgi:hypothetical protein